MRSAKTMFKPAAWRLLSVLGVAAYLASAFPSHAQPRALPDAVILDWHQAWTLNPDGSQRYYEKKHVQLNSDRVYDQFADPRITYNVESDRLDIINARVKRADGTYRELPPYAHVEVSPDATQGWPAFAAIRQHLLVMSGIEPGCVVELEYRVTSAPESKLPLAADVRADSRYPVERRSLSVTVPEGVGLTHTYTELTGRLTAQEAWEESDGRRTWTLTFGRIPATAEEPQALPWPHRGVRVAFSVLSPNDWRQLRAGQIESAAGASSPRIADLAREWTGDARTPAEKVRAVQEHLAQRFNFMNFPAAWRSASVRAASEVITCNYGTPEEAAALLLALARSAGVTAQIGFLVHADTQLAVDQDASVVAYVVVVEDEGTTEIWDPRHGRIQRDARWADHVLLRAGRPRVELPCWERPEESICSVVGDVAFAADGSYTGDLRVATSGLFAAREHLRTSAQQAQRVRQVISRVLPGAAVKDWSVAALGDNQFDFVASIHSNGPTAPMHGMHGLVIAQDDPALAEVTFPLNQARRETDVRLTGAYHAQLDLTVTWPRGWELVARPQAVGGELPAGLRAEQTAEVNDGTLSLRRIMRMPRRDIAAESYDPLCAAFSALRTERSRTLLLSP